MDTKPLPGRVILTYGRSLMALVIARSLARRGIEVIGCDDVALTVLSFSKHVRETFTVAPWESRPADFLDDLEAAVRTYAPADGRPYVLMPCFRDVELITRNRERFEPLIKVAAPDVSSFDLVHPKNHLSTLAESIHLPAPRSFHPVNALEVANLDLSLPVVVKPTDGVGGRGVTIAATREEMQSQCDALGFDPPPLIQTYAEGEDYCVAVLAKDGVLQAVMAYQNIVTFPRKAGAGAVRKTVDARPFRASVSQLMAATNWNGVAEIDYRWTGKAEDIPQVIEVNPRFWAGIFHSIETGVDFPWLLYQQTIGDPFEEPEPVIGGVTKTPGIWLLATLEDVAASDPHLNAAAEAWRTAKQNLATGKIARAMEDAVLALGATASATEAIDALTAAMTQARGAPTELSSDKDPLVGLGVLFVFSHLLRHRKLPPEITYTVDADKPAQPRKQRKRPVIGVTMPNHGDSASWWALKFAVWLAGGEAVKITAAAPSDPRTIDGVIFGGGDDLDPKTYNRKPKVGYAYDRSRGDMEASWAATARRHDLPVLGICRGAQMLNVFAGGTLHGDLSAYDHPIYARNPIEALLLRKPIRLMPGTSLVQILGNDQLKVNAIHRQAIDQVGAGLSVVAREPNGMVQGIEDAGRRFWIGVQFHPELLIYRKPFRMLFRSLISAARTRSVERLADVTEGFASSIQA